MVFVLRAWTRYPISVPCLVAKGVRFSDEVVVPLLPVVSRYSGLFDQLPRYVSLVSNGRVMTK